MLLTDYYHSTPDLTWEIGKQLGIRYGVIRMPENTDFDLGNRAHWLTVYKRFTDFGISPIIIEPLPNCIHDHIKAGDAKRDESIETLIKMFPIMEELDIRMICFNWMTYVGWLRTSNTYQERGGASVTSFNLKDFVPNEKAITSDTLWDNYRYFLKAVLPEAEKHGIKLALHPDDPPLPRLGNVERIMISYKNIHKAIYECMDSPNLGITFCQATYYLMGENLYEIIPQLADKIMFIHFRNVKGNKFSFHETFHDNGALDMPSLLRYYYDCGIDAPIRVDHVPTMAGEAMQTAGYDALGRLFAIGYLKGIIHTLELDRL